MTDEFMERFQIQYFKGNKEIDRRFLHTAEGLINRVAKRKKFISELKATECLRIQYGVGLLKEGIAKGETTLEMLKIYKAGLKTINAKFKYRIDFLVLITGAIVLFGLTGKSSVLLEVFPGLQASPLAHAPAAFVLGVLCLVGVTVFERASVLHLIAQNEELINVIDSVS